MSLKKILCLAYFIIFKLIIHIFCLYLQDLILEKHINKTTTQYILWRFAGNEDKENVELLHQDNKEDDDVIKKKYMVNPNDLTGLKECFGEEEDKKAVKQKKFQVEEITKKKKSKNMK